MYFPSNHPAISIVPLFTVSPCFTRDVPFIAFVFTMTPGFVATILQYSSSFIISGFLSASTTFTKAFVPFNSIPIHAKSFLSSLTLLTISFVFILFLAVPTFSPSCSSTAISSSLEMLVFPVNSIFHIKFDNITIPTTIKHKDKKKIFLFLYLLNINGKPFFSLILTLHFVFLAIFTIFL